ncbi:putative fzr protein [Metarhizium acridum CQMa 102]|uniref:Putative fzr protein n=1 Tax=Metarhizium acridum (strain CQMa 102) TaxID=655827 RepID=E9EFV5_METAQ|nr:putative fzr protein [Metarhizium acridum CQMa 102]EFY85188.1 putative fzr protein [Metarhizium acridum CQMa 102]
MYSLFSFRPCPDIGTSNRTGRVTTALSLGYVKGLNIFNQGNFQRGLPLFGHGLTSPPDLWPYSQIVSESSTEGSLVHSPTNAHAQSLKRLFAGRQQKSEPERVRNSLGIALNINFFRKILDFNLEPSSASSTIPLGDSVMGIISSLGNIVYTWSDKGGVRSVNGSQQDGTWLTSISFSSVEGNKNLFAAGRSDGTFIVMSLLETAPRFEIQQSCSVACLSWRPCSTLRFSSNPLNPNTLVTTEDLVVGDECGDLYYYLVEWPVASENTRDNWPGSISLVTRISIHSQQICGLAWSPNGALFASGANDNLCCLLKVNEILAPQHLGLHPDDPDAYSPYPNSNFDTLIQMQMTPSVSQASLGWQNGGGSFPTVDGGSPGMTITPQTNVRNLLSGCQSQVWTHQAAVKAIAFCPWLQGLVATGGGSNDKCIHFFHTVSGSSLATISVAAQVTSLIWSNTKREIAATFGYTHPEHPYRIAVFSWPDCSQIAAIPWEDDLRALHAVSYPCILKASKAPNRKPSAVNECIVVASSDKTVKFHEVWSTEGSRAVTRSGMFGGSDILEDLQGIIKEGDVIR